MKIFFLYAIQFPNGLHYIGMSYGPEARWRAHKRCALNGSELPVYRALRKYGASNCNLKLIASGSRKFISRMEIKIIASWHTQVHAGGGYNINPGGDLGRLGVKTSAAARKRLCGPRGPQTAEWITKKADARRGKYWSAEARKRGSESQKLRVRTKKEIAHMKVIARLVDHSDPTYREKLRLSALARWAKVRELKGRVA